MWPGEVPSDLDVHEQDWDSLAGRWAILVDLRADMQGSAGAYLFSGLIVPGLLFGAALLGWVERADVALAIAALVFVVCVTLSLHSYAWFRWADKRSRKVRDTMDKMLADDRFGAVRTETAAGSK